MTDFRGIGFDNDTEAVRVLSGTWPFHRNPGFGAPHGRPSVTLGPGDYPDVAHLPGYRRNHFPPDLMSSAKAVAAAPLQCAPGQMRGDTACHYCWDHYGNAPLSSWPSGSSNICDCATGYGWFDFLATEVDGVIFLDCRPY